MKHAYARHLYNYNIVIWQQHFTKLTHKSTFDMVSSTRARGKGQCSKTWEIKGGGYVVLFFNLPDWLGKVIRRLGVRAEKSQSCEEQRCLKGDSELLGGCWVGKSGGTVPCNYCLKIGRGIAIRSLVCLYRRLGLNAGGHRKPVKGVQKWGGMCWIFNRRMKTRQAAAFRTGWTGL